MTKAMNMLYEIGDTLYVNLTNRCPCSCTFCIRNESDTVNGRDVLWLEREPTAGEVIEQLRELDLSRYSELVFCGYGEPMEAFDVLKEVARWMKENTELPVRINTNGQGSLINGRDITPEFGESSILSRSASTALMRTSISRSRAASLASRPHPAMLEFARRAAGYVRRWCSPRLGGTITHQQERAARSYATSLA